jgi:hypothetical protein
LLFLNDRTRFPVVTAVADCTTLSRMDEARLIQAAQIKLRRATVKHFPPGPEREKRLNWLADAVAAAGSKRAEAPTVSEQSRSKFSRDASRVLYEAVGMDQKAIRRAALITLRRAICEHYPPGRERQKSLALLVAAGNERAASRSGAP